MPRPRKSDAQLAGTRKPGTPAKPPGISDNAALHWDRIVGELESAGVVLTTAHAGLLAIAATLSDDIAACHAELIQNGTDYTQAGTGAVKLHPAAARLDYLRRDLGKILIVLGAAKPGAEVNDGPKDAMSVLLGKR